MSESEFSPSAETRTFSASPAITHEPFSERREPQPAPPVNPVREGLPSTYRMRADAHYVDQLSGRSSTQTIHLLNVKMLAGKGAAVTPPEDLLASIRRHHVLLPLLVQRHGGRYRIIDGQKRLAAALEAGVEEVPCLLHDVEDADAAALAEAANVRHATSPAPARSTPSAASDGLAESVAAVAGAARLLSPSAGALSRVAALNLINAETWRAECLLESARLVEGKRRPASTMTSPFRIVEAVGRYMTAETRLRSAQLEVHTVDVPATTHVYTDEMLAIRALSMLAVSTLALLENVPDARITVRAGLRGNRSIAFEVFQDAVAAPASFGEAAGAGESAAGTGPTAVWIAGARQIADAIGAQISTTAAGALGTVAGFTLPSVKD